MISHELLSLALDARTNAAIERKFDKEVLSEVDSLAVVINTVHVFLFFNVFGLHTTTPQPNTLLTLYSFF